MPSYLTLAEYKGRTTIPNAIVDSCAARGKDVAWFLANHSSWLRARLVKRYAVDFTDGPAPEVLLGWLIGLVDLDVWMCTGGNPQGRVDEWYGDANKRIRDEVIEAANAETGLFELPLRASDGLGSSAVNQGGPSAEAYTTIHGWFDQQAALRNAGGW